MPDSTEPTSITEWLDNLWTQALEIWSSGGWAMWGIAIIAMVMFGMGLHIRFAFRRRGFLSVPEDVWRSWIVDPTDRQGPIGAMLDFVTGGRQRNDHDLSACFHELSVSAAAPFERDLRVMKVCVSAAPLVGLLGTVTGMLSTFGALASGSGGEKTMALVAKGISEALVTTETGLVIALPGLFFQHRLSRMFARYRAFLAHLETVCTQTLHLQAARQAKARAKRAAARKVARQIYERLNQDPVPV